MTGNRNNIRTSRRSGQGMIEFGLCSIVLIFLTMGIVQYGIVVNTENTLKQIAREGVRAAAVYGVIDPATATSSQAATCSNDTIMTRMQAKCGNTVAWSDISNNIVVNPSCAAGRIGGSAITVTVSYNMANKFFLPTSFPGLGNLNTTFTTTATAMME